MIVVEHDEDAIREADYVFDIGPGAGVHGGVWSEGTPAAGDGRSESLTGQYLTGTAIEVPPCAGRLRKKKLTVVKATGNNLQNVTVDFPLGHIRLCDGGVGWREIDADD